MSIYHANRLKDDPLLSICISTYNRAAKAVPSVKKILSCKDERFELVVRDNCSTDSTLNDLDEIVDSRLRVINGKMNLGGVGGILEATAQGHGDFLMVCLDKDLIEPSLIPSLLDMLGSLTSTGVGFCEAMCNSPNQFILYPKGFSAANQLGYRVRHPSGYFFRRDDYLQIVSRLNLTQKTTGGFPFEMLSVELATIHDLAIINVPIITTETKEEASHYKSHTYKGRSAFFFPRQKIIVFISFLSHLATLSLSRTEKSLIANKLFNETHYGVTEAYAISRRDIHICAHYGVTPRTIYSIEKMINSIRLCYAFLAFGKYPIIILRIKWMARFLLVRGRALALATKIFEMMR